MTRLLKIKELLPLRSFDSKSNSSQKVNVLPMVLTDGLNSIYAEAFGDTANRLIAAQLEKGRTVSVKLTSNARPWQSQDGKTGYSNDVRIDDLEVFDI